MSDPSAFASKRSLPSASSRRRPSGDQMAGLPHAPKGRGEPAGKGRSQIGLFLLESESSKPPIMMEEPSGAISLTNVLRNGVGISALSPPVMDTSDSAMRSLSAARK